MQYGHQDVLMYVIFFIGFTSRSIILDFRAAASLGAHCSIKLNKRLFRPLFTDKAGDLISLGDREPAGAPGTLEEPDRIPGETA